MKIVYFGTSEFAVPALEKLAEHVVLVVTQPDRPSGRGMKLKSSPVKLKAIELGLPLETPERARDPEFVQRIQELEADVHVVAAYGQILSTKLLETAKRGGINLHGSILPEYRGAAPIQRAIMDGKTETGVTLMQMDKGMDTGDIIDIIHTPIGPDETYGELHLRLSLIAAAQIEGWIDRIVTGDYPRLPQDHERATYAAKISNEEREINLERDARDEYNRYRGLSPYPGVAINTRYGKLKLLEIRFMTDSPDLLVGELSYAQQTVIGATNGSFELVRVLPEGKRPMSGREWVANLRSVGKC
ncbi:MAG: methionyl-tRNA formyltransferase [Armatimonadota bacterium]